MSYEGLEKALYDLNTDRRSRTVFKEEPEKFLGRYRLTANEVTPLLRFDVRALSDFGANPMLVWGYWMMCSEDRKVSSYLEQLSEPSRSGAEEE